MTPKNFSEAVLGLMRQGHRVEVANHLAAQKFPELFRAYHSEQSGIPAPDPTRPDVVLAAKARELAAREGISIEQATGRLLRENSDLARRYWRSFDYRS